MVKILAQSQPRTTEATIKTLAMKTTYKIINQQLFDSTVNDVDTSDLKCTDMYNNICHNFCAKGDLAIITTEKKERVFTGEHGSNDYAENYGFILTPVEN